MQTQPDTKEAQTPVENQSVYENVGKPPKNQPITRNGVKKGSNLKDPTGDQRDAIVTRINKAKSNTQTAQIQQAKDYADAVTDSVANLAIPLIGLNIIEKGAKSLASGGEVATSFLRSMPITGMTIDANSISMIDMDDQLELEAMDDPLVSALLLMGA
jgi:hypothetical protein